MSFLPPFEIGMMWSRVIADFFPGSTGISPQSRLHSGHLSYLSFNASHSAVVNVPSASAIRARRRCANTLTLQSLHAEKYVPFERRVNRLTGSERRHR